MFKSGAKKLTDERIEKLVNRYKDRALKRALDNIFSAAYRCRYEVEILANGCVYAPVDYYGLDRCTYPYTVQEILIEILAVELSKMDYTVEISERNTSVKVSWE